MWESGAFSRPKTAEGNGAPWTLIIDLLRWDRGKTFPTKCIYMRCHTFDPWLQVPPFFCIRLFPFINALLSSAVAQSCKCARLRLRPSSTLVSSMLVLALGNVFLYLYKALTLPRWVQRWRRSRPSTMLLP